MPTKLHALYVAWEFVMIPVRFLPSPPTLLLVRALASLLNRIFLLTARFSLILSAGAIAGGVVGAIVGAAVGASALGAGM